MSYVTPGYVTNGYADTVPAQSGGYVASGYCSSGYSVGDSGGFTGSLSDADIARIVAALPSAADIAAAVLAMAQITPIHADVRKVNGDTLIGHGIPPTYDNTGTMTTPGDPWRPA